MAQDLQPSQSLSCRCLRPEDVTLIGEHPIDAGGFANIYEATYSGRRVVLKSYRCYVSFDIAQVVTRFHNEVHVWTLLQHKGVNVVPLVGMYSTCAHPFGLVYEYMDGLNLRQYLRNEPNMGGLKLLMGFARDLNRMHDLDIVHGNLVTANILVDKDGTARIAGLGNASVFLKSTESTCPTEVGDIYAFGVVAWEVLTGRPPFIEMTGIAAMYSMLSGARPPRPNRHEISDRVWYVIERCWHNVPSKRISVREVVDLLEIELGYTQDYHLSSHAL